LNVNFNPPKSGPAVNRIRTGALVLAVAGGLAAAIVTVRLDRSLEASEEVLARAEDRIRVLEREAEETRKERVRLSAELRIARSELALLRAALAIGSAAEPRAGVAERSALALEDVADEIAAAIPEARPEAVAEPAPADPLLALRQREQLFGADAPAVEAMLTLHAEERFEELAALADAETASDPDFTFAWVEAGLAYARLGEVEKAQERLLEAQERAQDADPRLVPYYRAAWFALEDLAP
jgi:hypothetical protein